MKRKKPSFFGATPVPVKLDTALLARIDEVAARIGEQRSTVMRMAIRLGLEALTNAKITPEQLEDLLSLRPRDPASPGTYPEHQPPSGIELNEAAEAPKQKKKPAA